MGHSDTKITEIHASAIGEEKCNLVLKAWEKIIDLYYGLNR